MATPAQLPSLSSVMIATPDGCEMVLGYDLGLLAVTPDTRTDEDAPFWTVTHLPTGWVIAPSGITFALPEQALAYARAIEKSGVPLACGDHHVMSAELRRVGETLIRAARDAGAGRTMDPLHPDFAHLAALWERD